MPISKENIIYKDQRGTLHECMNIGGKIKDVPCGGHLYAFTIEPNNSRGDHYHKKKEEWFMCLQGEVEILLKDEDTNKEVLNLMKGMDGKLFYIAPNTRHTLFNKTNQTAIMISYGSIPFDPLEPDTFK